VQTDCDVAILGLGPVGLMCGNLLGQAGLRVVGIEMSELDPARFRPRAITMDDESLRLLQAIGLSDEVAKTVRWKPGDKRGRAILLSQFVSSAYLSGGDCEKLYGPGPDGGRLGPQGSWPEVKDSDMLPAGNHGWRGGATFYQPALEGPLLQGLSRFPNVENRLCTVVDSVKKNADGVKIITRPSKHSWHCTVGGEWVMEEDPELDGSSSVSDGDVINAKFVVACDGARSRTRAMLNPDHRWGWQTLGFEEDWCVLDVVMDETVAARLPRYTQQVCDLSRPCTFVPGSWVSDHPTRGRHMRWEFRVLPTDDPVAFATADNMKRLVQEWGIEPDEYEMLRFATYRFRSNIAPNWSDDRVFLCGDSAYTTPPFLGQGLNQGFKDAGNLCWKLAMVTGSTASPDLLTTYQDERYNTTLGAIERAVQMGRMITAFAEGERDGRRSAVMKHYQDEGHFANEACKGQTQLDPVVPDSRVQASSLEDGFTGRFLWQPSEEVSTEDGQKGYLDDLIGGHKFAVITRGKAPLAELSAESQEYLHGLGAAVVPLTLKGTDSESAFGGVFCSNEVDCVMVRPDRIIFGICSAANADKLIARLRECLNH